jgi:hypothetical protein
VPEPHDHDHDQPHTHAHESSEKRVHVEDLVLDIGDDVGALILYTGPEYDEREIELSLEGDTRRTHTAIHERRIGGRTVFAGVYPDLRAGDYRLWTDRPDLRDRVTIVAGQVSELDWRRE